MNRFSLTVAGSVALVAGGAQADITTGDPYLYGQGRYYHGDTSAHFQTAQGFFDIFVDLDMQGPPIYGPVSGATEIRESPTLSHMSVRLNGLPPGEPVIGTLTVPILTHNIGSSGQDTWFDTEMLGLNLTPPGGIMIRESPTLQSLGHTRITDMGGGLYRIDSFFDVFVELSLDGGATWTPQSNGPMHLSLVPTPGAATLLGLGGLAARRRRR